MDYNDIERLLWVNMAAVLSRWTERNQAQLEGWFGPQADDETIRRACRNVIAEMRQNGVENGK